ncbi:MAG: hypothetical protein AAFX08_07765 [Pseudomonadota bacterium]
MSRNWGIPGKPAALKQAEGARPLATLAVTAVFGVAAATIAAVAFSDAASRYFGLFHGVSLAMAVIAAGFGCWLYVFIAWPRFAANFTGGDGFQVLVSFYAKAAGALILMAGLIVGLNAVAPPAIAGAAACFVGGAAAAAAFHTVIVFVPSGAND